MPFVPDFTKIFDGEFIGRRIFGDAIFDGPLSQGSRRVFRADHFYDGRLVKHNDADGLSFDRLGQGNIDRSVLRELTPLADLEGSERKYPVAFQGWAVIYVKELGRLVRGRDIVPKPITGVNQYHAILRILCKGEAEHAYHIAQLLRFLASSPPEPDLREAWRLPA